MSSIKLNLELEKARLSPSLSLCRECYCATKTINGKCGKCKQPKNYLLDYIEELVK